MSGALLSADRARKAYEEHMKRMDEAEKAATAKPAPATSPAPAAAPSGSS